jgi:hypothetical protein
MELSRTVATVAVVLGVILAAGHAQSEPGEQQASPAAGATRPTAQHRLEEREAQRRAAVLEQEKRKLAFERACNKPHKTEADFALCKTAYKQLDLHQKN